VVVGGLPVAEEVGGEGQPLARDRAVVLDCDRHAGEGALVARPHLVRRRERVFGEDVDERVELGVERLDAIERRLHELARGQLAGADEAGELARRAEEEVGHGAGD
jgi:dienelactone hydrolase